MSLQGKFASVGLATLASRIGGFLRDTLIAALLGAGPVADAVFAAFLLPNLFRRMLSEGAFNAAFIPIFTRRESMGGVASAGAFSHSVLRALLVLLVPLFGLALFFMPAIVDFLVGGYGDEPAKFADAVLFSRISFAYVVIIILTALFSGILNAIGRYRLAAVVPVVFNLILVAALLSMLLLAKSDNRAIGLVIVAMVTVAGLVQLAFMVVALRLNYRFAPPPLPSRRYLDPDVLRLAALVLPGVAIAGAGHFNMLVAVKFASAVPASVSWLYYADRLFQLPLGLVATAIGIVMLPDIARHIQGADRGAIREIFSRALEFALALALPAAIALALLAEPIVDVLYLHGSFTADDAAATAAVLRALAVGLPAFVLVKVFLPSFLAREQFAVPGLAAAAALAGNVVVASLLAASAGFTAPAWGVAAAAWLNAALLALALACRRELLLDAHALRRLPRILAATVATGLFIWALRLLLVAGFGSAPSIGARAVLLMGACLAGVAVHLLGLWWAGALDAAVFRKALRR